MDVRAVIQAVSAPPAPVLVARATRSRLAARWPGWTPISAETAATRAMRTALVCIKDNGICGERGKTACVRKSGSGKVIWSFLDVKESCAWRERGGSRGANQGEMRGSALIYPDWLDEGQLFSWPPVSFISPPPPPSLVHLAGARRISSAKGGGRGQGRPPAKTSHFISELS